MKGRRAIERRCTHRYITYPFRRAHRYINTSHEISCNERAEGYRTVSPGSKGCGEQDHGHLAQWILHGRVLQCVAVCCSVLQYVAVCCSVLLEQVPFVPKAAGNKTTGTWLNEYCMAVGCSLLRCVAACCSVLQGVAVCCRVLQCVAVCCSRIPISALQVKGRCVPSVCRGQNIGAVCCSVLQCVAMCCCALWCVAVCRNELQYYIYTCIHLNRSHPIA